MESSSRQIRALVQYLGIEEKLLKWESEVACHVPLSVSFWSDVDEPVVLGD